MVDDEAAVELIRFLLGVGTIMLDDVYRPDSCIARTRIAIEFLRHHGVASRPMPVSVRAWNTLGWDLLERGVPYGEWPEEAWSIGVGGGDSITVLHIDQRDDSRKGFDGHLVAYVPMLGCIVDLTLQQLSRPHKDIHLSPAAVKLPSDWFEPHPDDFAAVYSDFPGVILGYQPLRCDPATWRNTPDWQDRRGITRNLLPVFVERFAQIAAVPS